MSYYHDYTASDGSLWHYCNQCPPIPWRGADWGFFHSDYDGAPDAFDNRHGDVATEQLAIEGIERMVMEMSGEGENR